MDWIKLKAFADDNSASMMTSVFDRKENVGKTRKLWSPAFSPFSTMFSAGFFPKAKTKKKARLYINEFYAQ